MSHPPADDGPPSQPPDHRVEPGQDTARLPARPGDWLGGGLLVLGIVSALSQLLVRVSGGPATPAIRVQSALEGMATVLAFALGGATVALLCRFGSSLIDRLDRRGRREAALIEEVGRAVTALERITEGLAHRPATAGPAIAPDLDGTRLAAEADAAARSSRWTDAESLLLQLEGQSPGHPAVPDLRRRIAAGRQAEGEEKLAQLEAARRVNDPDRVLELYGSIATTLEPGRRGELEAELARWFLGLIHRRLRLGKIQPDVVQLATAAAEVFAATVEGASLRAALPTLRRSVDLCPRCAQPYRGTAAACPKCLAGPPAMTAQPAPEAPEDPE